MIIPDDDRLNKHSMDQLKAFYDEVKIEGMAPFESLEDWQIKELSSSRLFAFYKLRMAREQFNEAVKRDLDPLLQKIKRLF